MRANLGVMKRPSPARSYRRGRVARLVLRGIAGGGGRLADAIGRQLSAAAGDPTAASRVAFVVRALPRLPWLPPQWVPWTRSPVTPWPPESLTVPPELQTVPGVTRDPAAEAAAHRQRPLHSFFALHADSMAMLAPHLLVTLLSVAPNLMRSTQRLLARRDEAPTVASAAADPLRLTAELKTQAGLL